MRRMTEENLKNALAGESQAHLRYAFFAELAAKENLPNISRLFAAASFSEQVHARNHLRTLGAVKKTIDNLEAAIIGEGFELEEMYPAYQAVAALEGEQAAATTFQAALEAEKVHHGLYRRAKEAAEKGKDLEKFPLQVCTMCGYTVEGEAPDKCPVCGAPKEKFKEF
jgi:rubrerythrin